MGHFIWVQMVSVSFLLVLIEYGAGKCYIIDVNG